MTRVVEQAAFGAMVLLALSFPLERLDTSTGITQDLRLTNLRLVLALVLVLWVLGCLLQRRWPRVPMRIAAPAAVWLAVVAASALLAPSHQTQALAFTRDLLLGAATGWAAYDLARSVSRVHWLARALAGAGAVVGLLGVAEAAGVSAVVSWLQGFRYQSFNVGELSRVSSTLPHPNIAAMILGLTVPLLIAWSATSGHALPRLALGVAILACVMSMVLTLSRSGVLVLMLVVGLMIGVAMWQHQTPVVLASLTALGGSVAVVGVAIVARPALLLHLTGESARGWYSASYRPPATVTARPGEVTLVPVGLANTGLRTWEKDGPNPFALSYHLVDVDDSFITYDGARTELPADMPPGSAVEVQAQIAAPPTVGEYVVEWDQVQESTTWFSWAGTPPGRTRLTVAGAPVEGITDWRATPPPDPRLLLPAPGRLELWRIALRMARNRPLLGVGPDNFRWVYGDFAQIPRWDTGVHANNLYMEWLADTGVIGLAAFAWFSWQVARSLRIKTVWQLALAASLASWYLHGIADYFFGPLTTNVGFWLVTGLALRASQTAQPLLVESTV